MDGLIKKTYYANYTVYGAKRIYEILKLDGYKIAYKTVFDCRSRNGLVSVRQKIKSLKISKPIKEYISVRKGHSVFAVILNYFMQIFSKKL